MRNTIDPQSVARLVVRYHSTAMDFEPSKLVPIDNPEKIGQILDLLHSLPNDADEAWDHGFETDYLVAVFRNQASAKRPLDQVDFDNDPHIAIYAGRIEADNGLFFSDARAVATQEAIYRLLRAAIGAPDDTDPVDRARQAIEAAQQDTDSPLAGFFGHFLQLLRHSIGSPEWQQLEATAIDTLQQLDGQLGDEQIPALLLPLEILGGPGLPAHLIHTIGSIGSDQAFEAVLGVLRQCSENGNSAIANACIEVLEAIDPQRTEQEGAYELMELAN